MGCFMKISTVHVPYLWAKMKSHFEMLSGSARLELFLYDLDGHPSALVAPLGIIVCRLLIGVVCDEWGIQDIWG